MVFRVYRRNLRVSQEPRCLPLLLRPLRVALLRLHCLLHYPHREQLQVIPQHNDLKEQSIAITSAVLEREAQHLIDSQGSLF